VVVTGQVSGAVVAVGGRVELGPNANVRGDVIARRGISLTRGAVVGGSVRPGTAFTFRTAIDAFGPFATWLAVMVSTLALGALLLVLAPRASERVAGTLTASPWRSSLLGLGLAIAVPLAALLLVVSLVAWPLGLAALLAVWFVASLGFAWSVFALGRRVWHAPRSRWLAFAFGWLILAAVTAIPIAGGIVWTLAAIVGVGAASLALWRSRVGGEGPTPSTGGRHRAGGRMPEPVPLVRESVMEQEGTGI
jgi:hypothetical protein